MSFVNHPVLMFLRLLPSEGKLDVGSMFSLLRGARELSSNQPDIRSGHEARLWSSVVTESRESSSHHWRRVSNLRRWAPLTPAFMTWMEEGSWRLAPPAWTPRMRRAWGLIQDLPTPLAYANAFHLNYHKWVGRLEPHAFVDVCTDCFYSSVAWAWGAPLSVVAEAAGTDDPEGAVAEGIADFCLSFGAFCWAANVDLRWVPPAATSKLNFSERTQVRAMFERHPLDTYTGWAEQVFAAEYVEDRAKLLTLPVRQTRRLGSTLRVVYAGGGADGQEEVE